MSKKEEFLKRILATFKIEAEENINLLYSDLIKLEKETNDSKKKELIDVIYRSAHSLKGASRAVNLTNIEAICHAFEGVFSSVRDGNTIINSEVFDVLHSTVDIIAELLSIKDKDVEEFLSERISQQIDILSRIESGEYQSEINGCESIREKNTNFKCFNNAKEYAGEVKFVDNNKIQFREKQLKKSKSISERRDSGNSTIRVSNSKLDKLLFQAEEMLEIKLAGIDRNSNLRKVVDNINFWEKEYDIYNSKIKSLRKLLEHNECSFGAEENLAEIIGFFNWTSSYIKDMKVELDELLKTSEQDGYHAGVMVGNLIEDVKDVITIPFNSLLSIFPKMVRDVAKDLGKEVDLIIEGGELEIDRRVLEKIKDPLIHLLRNAIDYGVESTDDRIKKSKSLKGKIILKIDRLESNKVHVLVEDDGAGIDIEKIKNIYAENNSISNSEFKNISTKDYLSYIFNSGISTSEIVTDISGRGIGLSIVKDNIEQIGGTVEVESKKDEYTRFKLKLPLSLVTYRGVIFKILGNEYIVPTSKVDKVLRLDKNKVNSIENKQTFSYNGEIIPLVNLDKMLDLSGKGDIVDSIRVIVLRHAGKLIGFIVDSIIGEQEVLVKKFNRQLSRVKYISGATVLGSGKIVPILNISDLFQSALSVSELGMETSLADGNIKEGKKSILVVEDSVTSRMLLKNILESSGFIVTTATDGIEGFTKLKEETFDAVVSDIEMPRLNGFELTQKIRNDVDNKSVPVVLVTSLSKKEHKEKGIDVGANAYIVKSSFDHSNLLEILNRLI